MATLFRLVSPQHFRPEEETGRLNCLCTDKSNSISSNQCEQHMALKETDTKFVQTVTRLMNLLDFYSEHGREEIMGDLFKADILSRDNQAFSVSKDMK